MKTPRYDWYGAAAGAGLPLVATIIEAATTLGSVAPGALWRAHLAEPLLWIMDTTPFVLGALGRVIASQHGEILRASGALVRQSRALVELEQARREGFERTAKELAGASQGLLGSVSAFTETTAEAASGVRETTAAIGELSQSAASAALTADTVIGLAVQSARTSEEGIRDAASQGQELARLADEVRALSDRIEALGARLAGAFSIPDLVAAVRERPEEAAQAAARVRGVLEEVQRALASTLLSARSAGERAAAGARVASQTGETIRALARAVERSVAAAKEIARVAQQQETAIEHALKAMKAISHATGASATSTAAVEREARHLNELAESLKAAVQG
jgi:methyl-accepting chemotaxis protein